MRYTVLNYFVQAEREYKRGEVLEQADVACWGDDRDKILSDRVQAGDLAGDAPNVRVRQDEKQPSLI